MSIKHMNLAWELPDDLGPIEVFVLLCLADHADGDGICWPGLKHVARKCRVSRRTVQRVVAAAEKAGWLEREERPGRSTRYFLHYDTNVRGDTVSRVGGDTVSRVGVTDSPGGGDTVSGGGRQCVTPIDVVEPSKKHHGKEEAPLPHQIKSILENLNYSEATREFGEWLYRDRHVQALRPWLNHTDPELHAGASVELAKLLFRSTSEKPWEFGKRLDATHAKLFLTERDLLTYLDNHPGYSLNLTHLTVQSVLRFGSDAAITRILSGEKAEVAT